MGFALTNIREWNFRHHLVQGILHKLHVVFIAEPVESGSGGRPVRPPGRIADGLAGRDDFEIQLPRARRPGLGDLDGERRLFQRH